jgi:DNA-binding transcriptional LysR family regulator
MTPFGNPVASGELAAFVAAYESGSLQGAADALTLTQSAVTKRIQALERRLGARVLDRGRLGVTPTPLGRAIYPPAKEALRQLDAVARAASATRETERADLRLSASHTIGEFLLPAWLSEFRSAHPEVHPQLEVVNSTGALAALRDGRSAIAFIESGEATPRGLEAITVARDSLAVVVSATHPWARRRALAPAQLAAEPYLTRERVSGTRAVATAALAAVGVELNPALEVASIQSLKRMLAGGGFTILSRLAIAEEERTGALVGLPVRGVDLSRELRAVRPRRRATGPTARRFWSWLAARRPKEGG